MDASHVKPLDQQEKGSSPDEILARRLKNRERQRRYRAKKKRLEADMSIASTMNKITTLQTEVPAYSMETEVPVSMCGTTDKATQMQEEKSVSGTLNRVLASQVEMLEDGARHQSTPSDVIAPSRGAPHNSVTRVYCMRNWKKDARKAHILNSSGLVTVEPTVAGTSETLTLSSLSASPPDNSVAHKLASRRHWKAEARSKKT